MIANIIRNAKKTVTGGDPYYSAVSLLLPMDGTNGSTTFTDSGPNALTVTATGASISTTQSKFGGASGSFDGTTSYLSPGSASATQFDFGVSNFTIEGWFYFNSFGGANYAPIFANNYLFYIGSAGQVLVFNGSSNVVSGNSGDVSLNTWTHVAFVRNGTTLSVYVNGTQKASATVSASIGTSSTNYIGRYSSVYLNGFIDDLRISRFARYVSNFTPPTAALPTTASSTPADPYYGYTSLLLHMDGSNASTNFADSGPNALTVTAVGNAQISTTQSRSGFGQVASISSGGNVITTPFTTALNFGSADFTIEMWVYFSVLPSNSYAVLLSYGNSGASQRYLLYLDARSSQSNPGLRFSVISASNSILADFSQGGNSGWSANTWYFVTVTRNGSSWRLFRNGIQIGSTYTHSASIVDATANGLVLGAEPDKTSGGFSGLIDDLRITKGVARYTSAFAPPAQAHLEYANGNDRHFSNVSLLLHMDGANGSTTFTDSSANSYSITKYGTAAISTTQSQFGGASAYFDGSGARLGLSSTAIDFGAGDFTAECWIYLNANPSSSYGQIIGKHVAGISASWIFNLDASRVLSFVWNNAVNVLSTGTALNLSQWYHIAACRNGSTIRVYINGIQSASTTISYTFSSATEFTVGSSSNDIAAARLNAYIDDIRLTKVARYTSNFTPPTSAHPNA